MKIGLIGEAPNDTKAIENLLSKRYKDIQFITLINDIKGSMLDNKKVLNGLLKAEFEYNHLDLVIFIRDLDSHENDKIKKKERLDKFKYANQIIRNKGILLLNIHELEALILADIEPFNKEYGCSIPIFDDPMKIKDPKEFLYKATLQSLKQFEVSHNPKIFSLLNFDKVVSNCRYFLKFIEEFELVKIS